MAQCLNLTNTNWLLAIWAILLLHHMQSPLLQAISLHSILLSYLDTFIGYIDFRDFVAYV